MLAKQHHFNKKAKVWKIKSTVKKGNIINPFSVMSRQRIKVSKIVKPTQKIIAF